MGRPIDPYGYLKAGHDAPFKPAKRVKEPIKNNIPYKFMPQNRIDKKKNYRDAEGAVILQPFNFVTSKTRTGKVGPGTSFGGNIPHLPEDPDILRKIR